MEAETATRVRRFEDLIAWQKARSLRSAVSAALKNRISLADRYLVDQSRRAAHSVMSNIAEGFGRSGPAEFHRFLSHARGSCTELQSHLYAALDERLISQEQFDGLYTQCDEVLRIVTALRIAVGRRIGGHGGAAR